MPKKIILGPSHTLTAVEVTEVANRNAEVKLSSEARRSIKESRRIVEEALEKGEVIYGITTGFGNFKNETISHEDVILLQKNLIRSHAAGVGDPFSKEQVRAILVTRLNSLCKGFSGIRLELAEFICEIINKNVIPYVPSQGSVGSSGDLAPLSHIGLVLMGEGRAWHNDKLLSGKEALQRAGLKPITFQAKEGLAFNNGTSVMTGIAALVTDQAKKALDTADLSCALTLEAIQGSLDAFRKEVHDVRLHAGQKKSAQNIRKFVKGSKLVNSIKDRIQDSYSVRCAPQVHGAVRDTLSHVESVVEKELNAVTDNPLVFKKEGKVFSAGNFHGEPVAIAMDSFAVAFSELSNISERRTAKLVDSATNEGLPSFLIDPQKAGLHSGLMIPQYTAAALVSENKVLSHPASVDSIPTSANQEDHVSMGTISARKAVNILKNVEYVLSIEVFTACQAIDFRGSEKLGKETSKIYKSVRKVSSFTSKDREPHKDIIKVKDTLFNKTNSSLEFEEA